jgi:hypothetical protein
MVVRGVPLYIPEDFYMDPASLKTSPPLGVPFCEEKITGPFACMSKRRKKESNNKMQVTFAYISTDATFTFRHKISASCQYSKCEWLSFLQYQLGRRSLASLRPSSYTGLPILAEACLHLLH